MTDDKLTETFLKYEKVAKMFQQYFYQDNLQAALDKKADMDAVFKMNDLKTNQIDFQQMQTKLESIVSRLKDLSVL